MRCLCCGEPIEAQSQSECNSHWHNRCIKDFFGTSNLPKLEFTEAKLQELIAINIDEGLTIPGVQKKLSLHLSKDTPARLTIVDYPTGYIMKPTTPEYDNLPAFEWLSMKLAKHSGIKTVPFALYRTDDGLVYLTRRIDRQFTPDSVLRYAMEDFCQLSERLSDDKYKGSYESCARIIRRYSDTPGLDLTELFLRVAFSFLIGNSDLHLKNLSLRETTPQNRIFILSEAYDILPVNVVEPHDPDEMALSLNGKKREITLEDFLAFAEYCEITRETALKILHRLCNLKPTFLQIIDNSFLTPSQKSTMTDLFRERHSRLTDTSVL